MTKALDLADIPVQMRAGGGPAAFLRKTWAIAAKDLRAEWRAREVFVTMVAFSVVAVLIFGMAFDLRVPRPELVAPGVFWATILFTGTLGLNRSFGAEADRQSLPGLLLAPMDRSAIYFGKLLASLLFMIAVELFLLPVVLVIFDTNLIRPWILAATLLGTVGYVAVGTLFAALAANVRARESMLPILLLPVMIPVFTAGLALSNAVVDGREFADYQHWLMILLIYDLIFASIAFLVFDLIWEDS